MLIRDDKYLNYYNLNIKEKVFKMIETHDKFNIHLNPKIYIYE